MADEQGNVIAPLPQGRRLDRDDVDPVEEVLAELSFPHQEVERPVGGRDHPEVDVDWFAAPEALDPARLEECAASGGGYAKWSITAHYQVDDGAVKTVLVTRADGSDLVPSDPTIAVGRGNELAVWFSATSVYGCNAYDSNLNANYRYTIH